MDNNLNNVKKALDQFLANNKKKQQDDSDSRYLKTQEAIARANTDAFLEAIHEMKQARVPDISIPEIKVPQPKIDVSVDLSSIRIPQPRVDVSPIIKAPDVTFPGEMDIKGWVKLQGVDLDHPLPVQLRDANGKPLNLLEGLTQSIGGGGGKADFLTIKGYGQSAFAEIMNPDGRVKVEMPAGSAGLTDAELRAAHLDVMQMSGTVDSVYVTGIFGSLMATSDMLNGDNRLKVSVETGGSGLTDTELRASSVPVEQVSGSIWSTNVIGGTVAVSGVTGSIGATILNGEGLARDSWLVSDITASVKSALVDSSGVQYSGSNPLPTTLNALESIGTDVLAVRQISGVADSVYVTGFSASVGATILNGEGLARDSWLVSDITASLKATMIDSSGVGYSGSNPVPVTLITSSVNSTITVGAVVSDAVDDGSAPIKTGAIARTANPTAVAGGDNVTFSADKFGRQINRPLQVKDLIATAYVAASTGTETTLLAAAAGFYHDLIWILASNNSTAAVGIDIRAVSAGNILMHLEIPANSTTGIVTPAVPMFGAMSDQSGNNWTVDLPDITGTTVYVSALFSKEI